MIAVISYKLLNVKLFVIAKQRIKIKIFINITLQYSCIIVINFLSQSNWLTSNVSRGLVKSKHLVAWASTCRGIFRIFPSWNIPLA